jgi:rod shape determining protein RodA
LRSCERIDLTNAGFQVAANFSSPYQAVAEADGDLKVTASGFFTASDTWARPNAGAPRPVPEQLSMSKYVSFRNFDWFLLVLVLLICALGVLEIYSATSGSKSYASLHLKQIYMILLGIVVMFGMTLIDYHALMERVPWMYILSVIGLASVFVIGKKAWGSRRWIPLPLVGHFQVSEFVKLVIILAMAKYFSEFRQERVSASDLIKVGLIAGIPMGLVLMEPDLGTSLTYLPIVATAVFLAGIRFKHLAVILLAVAVVLPAAWHFGLKPYQKARLATFVDPEAEPLKAGYQVAQSKIAVGSGGLWGKGTAKGTQTQLWFLPVARTDFIFAAFAEEHGFFGVLAALLLYFMVLMRLFHNAQTAPDRAGVFIVMGVAAVLLFHVLVNMGMVVGYMPVVGIPLPLMSYGGSCVLFTFMALGLINNVRMRRFVN